VSDVTVFDIIFDAGDVDNVVEDVVDVDSGVIFVGSIASFDFKTLGGVVDRRGFFL
jgi:hypothetical protein